MGPKKQRWDLKKQRWDLKKQRWDLKKQRWDPKNQFFFFSFFLFNFKLESLRNIRGTQNAAIQTVIGLKIAKKMT